MTSTVYSFNYSLMFEFIVFLIKIHFLFSHTQNCKTFVHYKIGIFIYVKHKIEKYFIYHNFLIRKCIMLKLSILVLHEH